MPDATPDEQLDFLKEIAARLESVGVPYMMTGLMALAVYATPRMTRDIDLVVHYRPSQIDPLVDLFATDCYINREAVRAAVETRSMFNIIHKEWIIKADFILRKDEPYRKLEFERRRQIELSGATISVVTAEDLVLSKLSWAGSSGSDLQERDVVQIIRSVRDLDWPYLLEWAGVLGVREQLGRARQK